jgi:hypothetical protein
MAASLDGVCYFGDPLGHDEGNAERGAAAVEFKTKTLAEETSKELATRDSVGAVCRCVFDVPGDGRNVGNDPASEAGEMQPLWPLCCGSVKAALVAIPAADHRAQLTQHCAVLSVTMAAYVVSDGAQIIRVVCVSFAKPVPYHIHTVGNIVRFACHALGYWQPRPDPRFAFGRRRDSGGLGPPS